MLIKITLVLILLSGITTLAGCDRSNDATVTGTVTYLQRIALPPNAIVIVRIEDVSKMDVAAEVVGGQVIHTDGAQVPIPFAVPYDPGKIIENHTYSLRVRIEDGNDKLLFINDTSIPVITNGNPTQDIEVIVVQVGG